MNDTQTFVSCFTQKPLLMGVINITPDSFSDGGKCLTIDSAIKQAESLLADGADILDLGAESTRPGSRPVSTDEEWGRLSPVVDELCKLQLPIKLSIDSRKPEILIQCAEKGFDFINNIEGLADSKTLSSLSQYPKLNYIAMHKHGRPETMQNHPLSAQDALESVAHFFRRSHDELLKAGFKKERIWLDPGIGFGKSDSANLNLLWSCQSFANGYQLTVGISRKGWIGRALGIVNEVERDPPSKMMELALIMMGVKMIRTHAIKPLRHLVNLLSQED